MWDPRTTQASVKEKMERIMMTTGMGKAFDPFASPDIDFLNRPEVYKKFTELLSDESLDFSYESRSP